MILLVDNYDSFAYNLVQYCSDFDEVLPRRNDAVTLEEIRKLDPRRIVLSPGPGGPEDAGICPENSPNLRGGDSHIGGLPGAPGDRLRLRSFRGAGKRAGARQDFPDLPFRGGPFRGYSLSLPGSSVSLPGGAAYPGGFASSHKPLSGRMGRSWPWNPRSWESTACSFHPESVGTEYGKRLLENFVAPRGLERSA